MDRYTAGVIQVQRAVKASAWSTLRVLGLMGRDFPYDWALEHEMDHHFPPSC